MSSRGLLGQGPPWPALLSRIQLKERLDVPDAVKRGVDSGAVVPAAAIHQVSLSVAGAQRVATLPSEEAIGAISTDEAVVA